MRKDTLLLSSSSALIGVLLALHWRNASSLATTTTTTRPPSMGSRSFTASVTASGLMRRHTRDYSKFDLSSSSSSRLGVGTDPTRSTSSQQQQHHSNSNNDQKQKEFILREFEKKQAAIEKRRREAQAKLVKYEESLQLLQSKKDEYLAASQVAVPPAGGSFSETTLRSAVKSFLWRVVAGTVTFCTSLRFSGSISTALKVVGADFFSKAFTMFLGERLMNKSQAGRKGGSDDVKRSLTKAIIWRLFAISNTLCMAVFVAKDLSIASKIASTDAVFKTMLMFAYERIWSNVEWGKEYLLEFNI